MSTGRMVRLCIVASLASVSAVLITHFLGFKVNPAIIASVTAGVTVAVEISASNAARLRRQPPPRATAKPQ